MTSASNQKIRGSLFEFLVNFLIPLLLRLLEVFEPIANPIDSEPRTRSVASCAGICECIVCNPEVSARPHQVNR